MSERMTAPASGVNVRMYRQGLGDCFLLAFPPVEEPRYLLIDCGVLLGTPDAGTKMRAVAENVRAATGGRLHVVVGTHEHWDHLSGFSQARDIFSQVTIDEVWLPWTENLDDPRGAQFRKKKQAALAAVRAAVTQLTQDAKRTKDSTSLGLAGEIRAVAEFFGAVDEEVLGATTAGSLEFLRQRDPPPRYREPGEPPIELPGVPGVRIFVLGPPLRRELLLRSDPSEEPGRSEVFEAASQLDVESAFAAAVLQAAAGRNGEGPLTTDERERFKQTLPFDSFQRIPRETAEGRDFFRDHYGFTEVDAWRRVDTNWLEAAGALALKLDDATNNTSLVLAIELLPSGKVLLFPADAQVGNWLSWRDVTWTLPERDGQTLSGEDLLLRTVLYKVGHHASHNATLKERGLGLMPSGLVALVPVDETQAHKPKGGNPDGWDMPFGSLLQALVQKTGGRVIRADTGLPERPSATPAAEWQAFLDQAVETDLYVEFTVLG